MCCPSFDLSVQNIKRGERHGLGVNNGAERIVTNTMNGNRMSPDVPWENTSGSEEPAANSDSNSNVHTISQQPVTSDEPEQADMTSPANQSVNHDSSGESTSSASSSSKKPPLDRSKLRKGKWTVREWIPTHQSTSMATLTSFSCPSDRLKRKIILRGSSTISVRDF